MASAVPEASPRDKPVRHARNAQSLKREVPPLLSKVSYATHVYGIQGMLAPLLWFRGWSDYFYPPDGRPNLVKKYEVRPHLPVRYEATHQAAAPSLPVLQG